MKRFITVCCLCLGLVPVAAWAQGEQHQHDMSGMVPKEIGTVSFETSCTPAVKAKFNAAVALLHSFWFNESRAAFEDVLKSDPNCAIAYWGIALTHWGNPFSGQRSPQTIAAGKAVVDKGLATGSPSAREKGYLEAVAILFSSNDVTTQRQRVLDFEKAMGRVSVANKQDTEARIFWALSVAQAQALLYKCVEMKIRIAPSDSVNYRAIFGWRTQRCRPPPRAFGCRCAPRKVSRSKKRRPRFHRSRYRPTLCSIQR